MALAVLQFTIYHSQFTIGFIRFFYEEETNFIVARDSAYGHSAFFYL
jgi:hypothetical protein